MHTWQKARYTSGTRCPGDSERESATLALITMFGKTWTCLSQAYGSRLLLIFNYLLSGGVSNDGFTRNRHAMSHETPVVCMVTFET
ncbi:hypothetical protein BaRGS_00001239 [Batillaria attramentaria]|uniref:Uncharacterized protein n=1 Tax=Batillaria attramentaria TaxID=370345 RepID=A0ABD0M5T0_9CAEN